MQHQPANINLHIDRVVIDEAVHRAGAEAVRAALEAQLPMMLEARAGGSFNAGAVSEMTANHVADRVGPSPSRRKS